MHQHGYSRDKYNHRRCHNMTLPMVPKWSRTGPPERCPTMPTSDAIFLVYDWKHGLFLFIYIFGYKSSPFQMKSYETIPVLICRIFCWFVHEQRWPGKGWNKTKCTSTGMDYSLKRTSLFPSMFNFYTISSQREIQDRDC